MSLGIRLRTVCVLIACVGTSCAATEDDYTYDEFRRMVWQEPDTGYYIVDGDELVEDEAGLRAYYDAVLAPASGDGTGDIASTRHGLAVNRINGADDRWTSSRAQNLTYCVSSASFGSRYQTVVNAMANAAAAWENVSGVNYVHDSSQDGNCNAGNSAELFDVRQVSGQPYTARAFFPSNGRSQREVLIDSTAFGNLGRITLTGVLRHELGHTLGFRHEHIRPGAGGVCPEGGSYRALTTYDSASVMHYPQCNGSNSGDLRITSRDASGAASLYP